LLLWVISGLDHIIVELEAPKYDRDYPFTLSMSVVELALLRIVFHSASYFFACVTQRKNSIVIAI
jgi:hypothetical protein